MIFIFFFFCIFISLFKLENIFLQENGSYQAIKSKTISLIWKIRHMHIDSWRCNVTDCHKQVTRKQYHIQIHCGSDFQSALVKLFRCPVNFNEYQASRSLRQLSKCQPVITNSLDKSPLNLLESLPLISMSFWIIDFPLSTNISKGFGQ